MRAWLLKILKVEERPSPPPGSEESLEVFHPSRRFFHYTVLGWAWKQFLGFIGIVVPVVFLSGLPLAWVKVAVGSVDNAVGGLSLDIEALAFSLMIVIESLAVFVFLVQLVASGLLLDLGWRMRWYMVSDESLRIREGLFRVREQTLRIANIQNIIVRQGPLQRLFGISDLEVHTAGGGGKSESGSKQGDDKNKAGHVGRFRGLADADSLRRRLQRTLARHGGAGLGEARERKPGHRRIAPPAVPDPAVGEALGELLSEARALRTQLESGA